MVLGDRMLPQANVIAPGAVIVGKAAGLTVITLDTEASVLPQLSVAVHVSVTVPPQEPGVVVKVLGFDVPLIKQPPPKLLLNAMVLGAGMPPHATVIAPGAVIVGKAAGLTVITLDTEGSVLSQLSVAVHVSVTVPPQAPGVVLKVLGFDVPLIKQPAPKLLLNAMVLGAGMPPHANVIGFGAVIVGRAAGLTVITLDTEAIVLPQLSEAVHVSVTVPPHAPGIELKVDGFEVPLIKQLPLNPFVKLIVLGAGIPPQGTVVAPGAIIVGKVAGLTVINRVTGVKVLPHSSVADHVSVIVPPHAPAGLCALKVEVAEVPDIKQPPLKLLLKVKVLAVGVVPQLIVMVPGAVIVGKAAGLTVINLVTGAKVLPHSSIAVHVSVIVPPHAPIGLCVLKVEGAEVPDIEQPPPKLLLNAMVLGAGMPPHATVIGFGAVIVGRAAGLTVIILVTDGMVLPHASTAVQVSMTVPPQAPAGF